MPLLNPALNAFPADLHHVHLMGACGTGMAALAGLLKKTGFKVTGSDEHVYPPMSDLLDRMGVPVFKGYSPRNLDPLPDLVVVGNVITARNPEALALSRLPVHYASLPQTLGRFFLDGKRPLVVAGTHGKTTTSSLLAGLLQTAGRDPGFMIGGVVKRFGGNFNLGSGDCFVVEGDEYDTAFFDKGPKFLHYRPWIAIMTSIEFDHADIYADLEAVKESFRRLVGIIPGDGALVACLDDPVVREVTAGAKCPVIGYGKSSGLTWSLRDLDISRDKTSFSAFKDGKLWGRFGSRLPGEHNALNSLAVTAVMDRLAVEPGVVAKGFEEFEGVGRRQEVRGEVAGVTVIDDFAHHPSAVRETLTALRQAYAGRRLVAVFEARTNSSRRKIFQDAYAESFDMADLVLIREPVGLERIPEKDRFSARRLTDDLNSRGLNAYYFADTGPIVDYLDKKAVNGDVVVVLSNGGFDDIHNRLLARLAAR